jgi:uncharacterized protein (DUF885 family)
LKWTRFAVLALALLALSCGRNSTEGILRPQNGDTQFAIFTDEYFARYFEFYPSSGTAAGLHQYDTLLEDFSAGRMRARSTQLRQQLARIVEIRKLRLNADNSIDAAILANQIGAELLEHDTVGSWRKNPMVYAMVPGNAVDLLMKRQFASPPERVKSVMARLKLIPALLASMRTNIAEPPREFTDLAIRMTRGSIGFFRDAVLEWARSSADGDAGLLQQFEAENAKAVAAFEDAAQFLERDLLPLSNGSYAIGADTFSRKLLFEEMVDTPLKDLLALGEANLERDYKAFLETARKINRSAKPADVMRSISNDHPSENRLIAFASATAEDIRKFVIERKIIPIPSEVRATIAHTPPYARSGGFASMDTPGAYETAAREAFYYITPPEENWPRAQKQEHLRLFNRPVMDVITIHEAYPGHYVQFLYSKEFPTRVRKLTTCSTNVEGWAHYTEQMMLEEGFGKGDPKIRLAQLAEALVRDARFVAGINLHTQNMTVEQATRLFVEKAFLEPTTAYEEARRGAYNPTYLYYTLGKLEIYKLREDYRRAKGSRYSLGQFHSDFIRQGPIPLKLVRQILLSES